MKHTLVLLVLLICLVAIAASVVDLRCGAVQATPNTLVVVCRASRL
jgi:hypothetical protein